VFNKSVSHQTRNSKVPTDRPGGQQSSSSPNSFEFLVTSCDVRESIEV
jgi:hypothetical protein